MAAVNPVTVFEFAVLSAHVYGGGRDSNAVEAQWPMTLSWRRVDYSTGPNGFFAAAYCRSDGATVVAYRGSDFSNFMTDWVNTDARIALGFVPVEQVRPANEFYLRVAKKCPGLNRTMRGICGHSLGGGLTQIVCSNTRMIGVTFNAPGMKTQISSGNWSGTIIGGADRLEFGGNTNVVNFRLNHEAVSGMAGAHIGKVVHIASSGIVDRVPGQRHRMSPVLSALIDCNYATVDPTTI